MFAIIPYHVDVPHDRFPLVNWLLVALTILLHFCIWLNSGAEDQFISLAADGWQMPGLFTHMFIHVNILHLVGNMIFLWVFGNAVCGRLRNLAYLPVYVILGLVSVSVFNMFTDGKLAGASGAINGIVGLYLVLFPLNEISCVLWILHRPILFSTSSFWIILYWLAFDIIFLLIFGDSGVAYSAHVGGFAGGVALGLLLINLKVIKQQRDECFLPEAIRCRGKLEKKDDVLPEYRQLYNELHYGLKGNKEQAPDEPIVDAVETKPAKKSSDYKSRIAQARSESLVSVRDGFIVFHCQCGKKLKVPQALSGKQGRCPQCDSVLDIPAVKVI
ncbi:MAG: rhomboid family intramembrane serine protease [Sedimentisphaerales bacterium]|nr:rhomboid family intramembrane serine protease [Sedimentisphaerales bacterium]